MPVGRNFYVSPAKLRRRPTAGGNIGLASGTPDLRSKPGGLAKRSMAVMANFRQI